jgi:hypothetical protein
MSMNRTVVATALCLCAGLAQAQNYYTSFENFTAGESVNGQNGWYTPTLVVGTVDHFIYAYGGDPYGLAVNPQGSDQFMAGRSQGGTALARAQHDVDFTTNDRWSLSYDLCPAFDGTLPAAANLASFSLARPEAAPPAFKQFISLNNFMDVNNPPAGWKGEYNVFDAAGTTLANQSPGAAWTNLTYNAWYRLETVVNFATNRIESVSITNLSTCEKTTATPEWYVTGGAASVLPLPPAVRCFAGGGLGNIAGYDNVYIKALGGCEADFNGDDQVDFFDYLDFASAFDAQTSIADFNGDCQVDFFDYLDFASAFDACS